MFVPRGVDFAYIVESGPGWDVRKGTDLAARLATGWVFEDAVSRSAVEYSYIQIVTEERRVGLKRVGVEWRGGDLVDASSEGVFTLGWRARLHGRDPVDVARRLLE